MKIIVAGGRDYVFTRGDAKFLDTLDISEVVSGGCSGADRGGEKYAKARGIPLRIFNANWKEHGRAAGPIRNNVMAQYADGVALFKGGRGTNSMYKEAGDAGILIFDRRG